MLKEKYFPEELHTSLVNDNDHISLYLGRALPNRFTFKLINCYELLTTIVADSGLLCV